jgi:hypothetical protein
MSFYGCSKQRHTARQHPIEGRIYYPFHPRCGETVQIVRQYAYRGVELVVIPQPDGSIACIPAWMTHESAAHHQLRPQPWLSLDILRSLRVEIDALLGFLQSESKMENANNEAQERTQSAGSVRARRASRLAGPSHGRNSWRRWSKPCCSRSRRRWQARCRAGDAHASEYKVESARMGSQLG